MLIGIIREVSGPWTLYLACWDKEGFESLESLLPEHFRRRKGCIRWEQPLLQHYRPRRCSSQHVVNVAVSEHNTRDFIDDKPRIQHFILNLMVELDYYR